MVATQIYLDDEIHLRMKRIVMEDKTTNRNFITEAVFEKVEREENKRSNIK